MDKIEKHIKQIQHLQDGANELDDMNFSNDILDLVVNSLEEGIIIANKNGDFVFFNEAAEKILGIGSLEIPTDEWSAAYGCFYPDKKRVFPPESLPLYRAITTKETSVERIFIRNASRPDGLFITVYGSPILSEDGTFIGGVALFRDITDSVIAENKLKISEEKFKSLFRGIPIPTYVWQKVNDQFILIDYNYFAELITKNNIIDLRGQTLEVVFPGRPEVYSDFELCYTQKKPQVREMTYRMKTTDEIKDFYVTYAFVEPDIIMVHTQDITKRKSYEKELRKLSNAVQQTEDSILISDVNGHIEYVNNAFEKTYGYSSEEILGKTPSILKSGYHDEEFYKELWNTVKDKRTFKGTILNKKKDGTTYWVQQTISPILGEDGEIINFVSVNKDITELRKRIENEMELLKADNLLLNILPEPIAKRLKNGETSIADYFDEVSVIFIDIVGFTHMSSMSKPHDIVKELNKIFTILDKLSEKYGIEKIKTLGDCYMAASGVPVKKSDHARSIALMALETRKLMEGYKTAEGFEVKFRMGIDCGPVVAGVIGEKKFIYDLWGQSVNTASRMKDSCDIDKIHCTERFIKCLKSETIPEYSSTQFIFSEKEKIDIKGIGEMTTHYLLGKEKN